MSALGLDELEDFLGIGTPSSTCVQDSLAACWRHSPHFQVSRRRNHALPGLICLIRCMARGMQSSSSFLRIRSGA
jgi:hypothetical protein